MAHTGSGHSRRWLTLLTAGGFVALVRSARAQVDDRLQLPGQRKKDKDHEDDNPDRLPNGKSRSNAIAAEEHKKAMAEVARLVEMAQQLKTNIGNAGNFVVPISALRLTEDIEKLAKTIRGRLKS